MSISGSPLPDDPLPVADTNVARLLHQAPAPETPSPDFVRRTEARLLAVAAERARQRGRRPASLPWRPRLRALAGVAALLAVVILGRRAWRPNERPAPAAQTTGDTSGQREPDRTLRAVVRDRLIPAPRPTAAPAARLAVGSTLHTRAGERRRVSLEDGSVAYLNEKTILTCDTERHITVGSGEVFVEVAARSAGEERDAFVIRTPQRRVEALGTKLAVRVKRTGTGVLVTQGKVRSDGIEVASGQELAAGSDRVTPAPRVSAPLGWLRDLMEEAGGRLLPLSRYRGGALVAGPAGRETRLTLRRYHLDVHIEDGFARTTIDQTYFNPTGKQLEGTFHFPLPPDASLSRLAMYVDGTLMEGGMIERAYGRAVFDQIVTRMKDPALLEWVDGSTFKMRVFPLEPYQEKRIVLCYVQRLPGLHGRLTYRFPSGHSLGKVRDWSFQARIKDGASETWSCPSHAVTAGPEGSDLVLRGSAHDVTLERDVVLEGSEKAGLTDESVRLASAAQDGARYLMVRYRPALDGPPRRERRDWVFLVETSGERTPLLARTQVEIVRTLLANAEHDDTFALLTIGTRVRSFAVEPKPVTPENAASALAFLEESHLIGGLDLGRGLSAAADLLRQGHNPYLIHLGSALPVVGEKGAQELLRHLPEKIPYVGVVVGKRWNRAFVKRAAERTSGHYTQINPDEPIAWRAFDLLATLATPRLLNVRVEDAAGKSAFLCLDTMVSQGEEVCAVARFEGEKGPLPERLVVRGTLDGRPFERVLPVAAVHARVGHLPRTWAKLEIDRLLAEGATKNREKIVALSKAMYVMTPFTSLLVLENEAMYRQYKVDRGRKDHWAPYACPAKIPVISEPPERETAPLVPVLAQATDDVENYRVWKIICGAPFDQIRGAPLIPLDDAAAMQIIQENNQLGFYQPANALVVKASSIMHAHSSNLLTVRVDGALTDKMIALALNETHGNERSSVLLAALGYFATHRRYDRAESVLAELLADPALSRSPALWHLGALLALDEKRHELAVARQEHSLNLEYAQPSQQIDPSALRSHYEELMSFYEQWIQSLRDRRQSAPVDLVKRVVRMTDRWRYLDPDGKAACTATARVLRLLGAEELARDYETTALIGAASE